MIKSIRNGVMIMGLILTITFNSLISIVNADTLNDLTGEFKSVGSNISPIQVKITSNGALYMLPTYATPQNLTSMPSGCTQQADSSTTAVIDRPNGAIRVDCATENDFKLLLANLKIANSITSYGTTLTDIYIPRYYILEQEVTVDDAEYIKVMADGSILYDNKGTLAANYVYFNIFDPDFGNSNGSAGIFEKGLYLKDSNTPDLGVEAFALDGSRLSPESINAGVYTLEHYLSSYNVDRTYDSSQVFGFTTNTLKYALNLYTQKMEEKVFREVCNQRNPTDIYKNDTFPVSNNLQLRTFLGNLVNTRVDAINDGDCAKVNGLRYTPNSNIGTYMKNNGSLNMLSADSTNAPTLDTVRSPSLAFDSSNYAGGNTYLVDIKNTYGNNSTLSLKIPKIGVIGHTRDFTNQSETSIKSFYNGKKVKLYFLIKMTAYFPSGNTETNKYLAGLDPMNPHYYDVNNHLIGSTEIQKYLLGNHQTLSTGTRAGAGDANYYVLLGTKRGGEDDASSIYMLSAPGFAMLGSEIRSGLDNQDNYVKGRMYDMNLNISQGFMETERSVKSDQSPHLNLLSPVRLISNDIGVRRPNLIFRNFESDQQDIANSWGNTNMEQNLDYVVSYKSDTSELPAGDGMLNSVTGNGLIANSAFETHFWYNSNYWNFMRDVSDSYNCLTDINGSNFTAGIYNLAESCSYYTNLGMKQTLAGDNAVSNMYGIGKRYQQFEGYIQKNAKGASQITKGMLMQTIANMGDTEVYNQIYLNTNFVVGLPNKEPIACEIDLYKLPVDTTVFPYTSKFNANTNLTADATYSTFSNMFGASPANYINDTVLGVIKGDLKSVGANRVAFKQYMNTQYVGTEGNMQKWLVGEKGLVMYKCTKNGQSNDEVVVSVRTSDKKYLKNAQGKLVEQASTNKLSDTVLKFNTGSSFAYMRTNGETDSGPVINGTLKTTGYLTTQIVSGFKELTLGSQENAGITNGEIYLGMKSGLPGYFKGGIEVVTPIGTSAGAEQAYGRVDVLIYDKNRPGQILDQKTYYITTQAKDGAFIYADGGVANWDTASGGLSAINHTDGATFGVNNASAGEITATDATTGLNVRILPFNANYSNATIKNGSGYTLGEAACTALGVQCGGPTFNTNQDGYEFIDGVINSAGNTASPKLSIALKSINGTVINSTAVQSATKQATSFAYSFDATGLKIIFPGNYQKLASGDYLEVKLAASPNTYTNASYNWMRTIGSNTNNATAFSVNFYDGNTPVSGIGYKNYSPVIRVNATALVTNSPANGYCTVLTQRAYDASNDINQCLATGLTSSSNAISIEEDNIQGNQVTYTLQCGNSGGETFVGNLKFYISNLSRYEYVTNYTATNTVGYPNIVREEGSDQIAFEDITIAPGETSTITVAVDLEKRNVSCPDTVGPLTAYARLSSSTPQGNLPYTSNTVTMRECKLPTLTLNSVTVSDGNTVNDKVPGTYSSAYPFEFSQCGNNLQYRIDGKFECFTNDPTLKNFNIKFTAGTTNDGAGLGRDFINTWMANSVLNVSPVVTGKSQVEWNLSGSTIDFNGYPSGTFSPTVYITPTLGGDMRLLGSKWSLTLPVGSPLKLKGFNGLTCVGNVCESGNLDAQIALDPTVSGQKIYDNGILPDANFNTANLHREEIDGSSKIATKSGASYYEPIYFETTVNNPSKNQTEYGMNSLFFNLGLNPNTSGYFEKVAPTSLSVPNIAVENGEPMWKNQILPAGGTLSYSGGFNVVTTLNTPFNSPANSLKNAVGTPALKFTQDGPACSFTQGFAQWTSEIYKNPITIDDIAISDRVSDSLTPGYDPVSNRNFEQHLPGDVTNILVAFNNNSTTRDFGGTFVKITFDPTASGKLSLTDVPFDFDKVFDIEGNVTTGWTVLPDGTARCQNTATELLCEFLNPIPHNQQSFLNIPLRINLESDFYNTLKNKPDTTNWKYWFPVVISKIEYGTPDLNLINNVVYYTSDLDNIPSGGKLGDIETDDINIPENRNIPDEPIDGNYSFYIGVPYAEVQTQFVNASVGNYSPGDIGNYTTTIRNIGKASLKNPQLTQDLFSMGLNDNWVDSSVYRVVITPETAKTNISAPITLDFNQLNTDANPTNDVNVDNLSEITLSNGTNSDYYSVTPNTKLDLMPKSIVTINGSNTLVDGGSIVVQSLIKIKKIKDAELPQINCKTAIDCTRANTNPKNELFKGVLDLPYVGNLNDAEGQVAYGVHFPILKSLLFAKTNNDYRAAEGSNTNIRGMLNSDNTTVAYRVDNIIPQEYTNFANEKVGKARNPEARIKLPSGVTYVANSLNIVQNIVDGSNSATENTTSPAAYEPTIVNKNDYGINTLVGEKSFDTTFLNNPEWRKVIGSNDNHFSYMKGATFNVNFFNKGYNYYRITDDASLVLGYKQNNSTSFEEGQYYLQKKVGRLSAANTGPVIVKVDRMKDGVILPNGTKYLNEKGEYAYSNGEQVKIGANSTLTINASEYIDFTNGLEGVTYEGEVTAFNSEVNTDITEISSYWNNYTIISPIFAKLNLNSGNSAHGVYEKIVKDVNGNVTEIWYQWNGVLEGTNKPVQVGVILYAGAKHNNIKFTYGNIDNTINMNVISGLSDGAIEQKLSPYHGLNLGALGMNDDIEFDASPTNVYQELVFPIGYAPDIADPVQSPVLMPQEKDNLGVYTKGPGKDNTSYIYTFNVRISTNDLVCGTEYATSDGGNSLSWGRTTSTRSDKEDIDTFCFSSLKPTIKILDNGSYARGGYKSSTNNCTVNHLALMGFNARAIGWNNSTQDGCWLTYNIQSVEKDLSMYDISPYDLLGKFKDRTDARPIDTTLTMNSKHLELSLVKDINVRDESDNTYKLIGTLAPGFKANGIKIITKGNFYIYGNDSANNGYLLRTSDEGDHYNIVYKSTNKAIENVYLSETLNLIFFANGTYIRDVNAGLGPWSNPLILSDYTGINDVLFLNNTLGYVLGKSGVMWKTIDGGTSFTKINIKNTLSLSSSEELTKIANYLSKELWITTNRGSILYSNDAGITWIKKTTGVTSDQDILTFEDGQITIKDLLNRTTAGSNIEGIDTVENGSSLKFDNFNNRIVGKAIVSNTSSDSNGVVLSNTTGTPFTLAPYISAGILKGDIYLDIYITNPKIEIEKIIISGGGNNLQILNPSQFNIDNSGNFKPGLNTIKVPVNSTSEAGKYIQSGTAWSGINKFEVIITEDNKSMLSDYILLSNLQVAPITNITNIVSVYQFGNGTLARNTTEPQVLLKLDQPISLGSYKNSNNIINGILLFDIYVSNPTNVANLPDKLYIGNSNGNGLVVNNLFSSSILKSDMSTPGWKTFALPLNANDSNIVYTNRYDINWNNIDIFKLVKSLNDVENEYVYMALDNVRYSSSAGTSLSNIYFFNSLEGIAFGNDTASNNQYPNLAKYTTYDNVTWSMSELFNNVSPTKQPYIKGLKGRELYGVVNATTDTNDTILVTFYSLDKGLNLKKHTAPGLIMNAFDVYDSEYGLAVSSTNNLYSMSLVDD